MDNPAPSLGPTRALALRPVHHDSSVRRQPRGPAVIARKPRCPMPCPGRGRRPGRPAVHRARPGMAARRAGSEARVRRPALVLPPVHPLGEQSIPWWVRQRAKCPGTGVRGGEASSPATAAMSQPPGVVWAAEVDTDPPNPVHEGDPLGWLTLDLWCTPLPPPVHSRARKRHPLGQRHDDRAPRPPVGHRAPEACLELRAPFVTGLGAGGQGAR